MLHYSMLRATARFAMLDAMHNTRIFPSTP
jgi:hypothetical protein